MSIAPFRQMEIINIITLSVKIVPGGSNLFTDTTLPIKIPKVSPMAICNNAIGGVCLVLI
jgi:hypothetical protein